MSRPSGGRSLRGTAWRPARTMIRATAVGGPATELADHRTRARVGTRDRIVAWSGAALGAGGAARWETRWDSRLRAAGLDPTASDDHRARQVFQAGLFALAGGVLGAVVVHSGGAALVAAVVGAGVGWSRQVARVARLGEERRERLRLELVTVDLLLAMHVRSGAGPIQAVGRVVARGDGLVVGELARVLAAIRSGRSEAEAFRHAAATTVEPHAARTYRLFALAAEQGADLGPALLALSDDLRSARREELRRQATRRRAAMLLPTIAVLAPVMLLFVLAPLPSIVLGGH